MFVKLLTVFASIAPVLGGALIPEWVQRRLSGDIYNYVNSEDNASHKHCDNTYLVDDNQCVMDQELFVNEGKVKVVWHKILLHNVIFYTECSHPIIPVQSSHLLALPVAPLNNTSYLAVDTTLSKQNGVGFRFNGTDQIVNSSFCHILSLEVYRGREQVTGISHQGFSLTDSGAVEVYSVPY